MKRTIYNQLKEWKKSGRRKPLLLQGARQVGKTYLINEFGKKEFKDYFYLNFEEDEQLKTFFSKSLSAKTILENLSLYLGKKIEPGKSLLFFDEIQTVPEAITSLKYFFEQAPEQHLIAAGSLLGVSIGKKGSFPVGKVNFMTLFPMSFVEYLMAIGEDLLLKRLQESPIIPLPELIHQKLINHLKRYLFLGGMPEVLKHYIKNQDIAQAREIQNEILEAYKRDFSKYTDGSQAIKTAELWQSIPYQLAKENKKFKYSDVRRNARASTFEQTIQWLKQAGLIHPAYNISTPKIPLAGYADHSTFKIYLHDTGLLAAMLHLTSDTIIRPGKLFSEYNGAFVENFIANELKALGQKELYYWTSKSDAEVDFIIHTQKGIYPLEVKSGTNRHAKSLRSYAKKYKPSHICRISPRNFTIDNDFINIPLYLAFRVQDIPFE